MTNRRDRVGQGKKIRNFTAKARSFRGAKCDRVCRGVSPGFHQSFTGNSSNAGTEAERPPMLAAVNYERNLASSSWGYEPYSPRFAIPLILLRMAAAGKI
jgi:hypothetical protein